MKKALIIQTAFIGDVILATVLIEKLHASFPEMQIDFLLRKGNEKLLRNHPFLNKVIIWDKIRNKYLNLLKIILNVRKARYDIVVNAHRFSSSGIITYFSGARHKSGFDKNPLSSCYNHITEHKMEKGIHEIGRNLSLLDFLNDNRDFRPKLYFSDKDREKAADMTQLPYVIMAPASVWFTKQLPADKWAEIAGRIPPSHTICLIGGGNDLDFCEEIINISGRKKMYNLAGKLDFLESAAIMANAAMNIVNDSAPLHIASAVNAPVTAVFCSTIPDFGFGPVSDKSRIIQFEGELPCRPCGLHGLKSCPEGHFRCAKEIAIPENLLE